MTPVVDNGSGNAINSHLRKQCVVGSSTLVANEDVQSRGDGPVCARAVCAK